MIQLNEHGTPQLNTVHHCDALKLLGNMVSQSVDAIIGDPPYTMTELAFDQQPIDWQAFWVQARRVLKYKNSPVILFSQQPFTTDLIMSNRKGYRNEIIYEKTHATGFLNANRRPLQAHENILIFSDSEPEYTAQMESIGTDKKGSVRKSKTSISTHWNEHEAVDYEWTGTRYPRSVWKFANRKQFDGGDISHPTQKPVGLMERLMLTYTQAGWLIVDPFCGSGTTGAAAQNTGRDYIMSEIEAKMAAVAQARLMQPFTPSFMPQLEVQAS